MFEGFYNSVNVEPVADFGAHRLLNMDGSLMGYIQTGNQYNKHYYRPNSPKKDEFIRKNNKTEKTLKSAGIVAIAAAAAVSLGALLKKDIKIDNITSIFSKIKK